MVAGRAYEFFVVQGNGGGPGNLQLFWSKPSAPNSFIQDFSELSGSKVTDNLKIDPITV
jgi:hypothetical protein